MKNKKGFTLIELLAVIVILGILLSISITAVNKIRKKQNVENKLNVISGILTGAKRYVSDNPNVITFNSNGNFTLNINDLIDKNYVDVDEEKYPDLVYGNNGFDTGIYRHVTIHQCESNNNKLEYRYYLKQESGGWKYKFTDCGCEKQASSTLKSPVVCEEGSTNGWYSDGSYTGDATKNLDEYFIKKGVN